MTRAPHLARALLQVSPAEMRLYADTESSAHAMADKDTLEKLGVQPEQALALVFKLPGARQRAGRLGANGRMDRSLRGSRDARITPHRRLCARAAVRAGTDDFEPIEIASDAAQLGDGEKAD